jgi:hypothetical protein
MPAAKANASMVKRSRRIDPFLPAARPGERGYRRLYLSHPSLFSLMVIAETLVAGRARQGAE